MTGDLFTSVGVGVFRTSSKLVRTFSGNRRARKPFRAPKPHQPHAPTSIANVDKALKVLEGERPFWALTTSSDRVQLLEQCIERMLRATEDVVERTVEAKGSYEGGKGEERMAWASVLFATRHVVACIKADYKPSVLRTRRNEDTDQVICQTFPSALTDKIAWFGVKGEVWLEPGKEFSQGLDKTVDVRDSSLWLVLAAGNQTPAVVGDLLHCLFMKNAVVICKLNPINDYLGPVLEDCFKPLVDKGVLRFVYGGCEIGAHLCTHDLVQEIHMTGSTATFDAIMWMGGPKVGKPKLNKPVHGELGSVSPYVIVPGHWSDDELDFQARQLVSAKVHNCGHNCLAMEVLVMPQSWHLREKFIERVKFHLNKAITRVPWYPHSDKKYKSFLDRFPNAELIGETNDTTGQCAFAFAQNLTPDEASTEIENWMGVFQEVCVPYADVPQYLAEAAAFCNDKLWGNLSCAVIVDNKTQAKYRKEVGAFIGSLKYGCVAVNLPAIVGFGVPSLTWGAFPGNDVMDISSGNCIVHNTSCVRHVQKSVLYGPWKAPVYPVWNFDNTNLESISKAAAVYFAYPSIVTLAPLAYQALVGQGCEY